MNLRRRTCALLLLLVCVFGGVQPAMAHVGSKDVFEEVNAGGYKLFVTIRMPTAIPGVAAIEVRASGAAIREIRITPMPITGEAADHPPTPDVMVRSKDDPDFYTGNLYMMATGSWEVRFQISGADGDKTAAVAVPAVALSILKMGPGRAILLSVLALLLLAGAAGIVAAVIRESDLKPGVVPDPLRRRQGLIAAVFAFVVMSFLLGSELVWWKNAAAVYATDIYKPLDVQPVMQGNILDLKVSGYVSQSAQSLGRSRQNSDFLPDHGHMMHLYMIREPEMDAVYHVHPELVGEGDFRMRLPTMPAGEYKLYGDVVHANGFPETLVTTIHIPAGMTGNAPGPDDAAAMPAPLSAGMQGASSLQPDGYTMVWDKPRMLTAGTPMIFHFSLLDAKGKAAADVVPYMGMAGHAAFVKTDGTVFAHTHPEGSASMAAMMLANASNGGGSDVSGDAMAGMPMNMPMAAPDEKLPNTVEFPYGFPTPGRYRIFIQMRHGGTIETGTFDAMVQ